MTLRRGALNGLRRFAGPSQTPCSCIPPCFSLPIILGQRYTKRQQAQTCVRETPLSLLTLLSKATLPEEEAANARARKKGNDGPFGPFTVCLKRKNEKFVGSWLSLVERLVRVEEVAGSNPAGPTTVCFWWGGAWREACIH